MQRLHYKHVDALVNKETGLFRKFLSEEMIQPEQWKDVPGYEGYYQASDKGRVRSLDRYDDCRGGLRFRKGRLMKGKISRAGYHVIGLRNGAEKPKHCIVHRLVAVAIAFLPNPENKPTVNHIDGVKLNNDLSNLEWATASEQMLHAIGAGLYSPPDIGKYAKRGEEGNQSKLTEANVKDIRRLREDGRTLSSLANQFGTGISQIHRITKRLSWEWLE